MNGSPVMYALVAGDLDAFMVKVPHGARVDVDPVSFP